MTDLRLIPPLISSLLLIVACSVFANGDESGDQTSSKTIAVVEIKNLKFLPAELTVAAGTTVRWINRDPVDHDATSGVSINGRQTRGMTQTRFPDHKFASGLFGQDKSFSVTFAETGEYKYYCNVHPFMVATIVVK